MRTVIITIVATVQNILFKKSYINELNSKLLLNNNNKNIQRERAYQSK